MVEDRRPQAAGQGRLGVAISQGARSLQQQRNIAQLFAAPQVKSGPGSPSPHGLPAPLRGGIEALSGLDLSDVRVHRNSSKPAQLNALAYAEGSQIHLGPGQEKHLSHEAWHVVQQKQGRVRATRQMKGVQVNEDASLEREAEAMGAKALSFKGPDSGSAVMPAQRSAVSAARPVVQRVAYRSKDRTLQVDVDAGDYGCRAQTVGQKDSSLEYRVFSYRDQRKEDLQPTRAAVATQTDTMHAYPEGKGIGTLLLYHTLMHFQARGIHYFQPDAMRSKGGNAMLDLVGGTHLNGEQMARVIANAEGGGTSKGCWAAFKRLFCCCGPSAPEEAPLLPNVLPAEGFTINNPGIAIALLGVKVRSKFDAV